MHLIRKVLIAIAFLGSWVALLVRFGASRYDSFLFYTDVRPSTSYIEAIGLAAAAVYMIAGIALAAVISGRIDHDAIKRTLGAVFGCITMLVVMLGGADLSLAIIEIQHFVVVHCDVG